MGSRALGEGKWHSSTNLIAKPNLVSTTLLYPMTLTTGSGDTTGLAVTGNIAGPAGQQLFTVENSSGQIIFVSPNVGGAKAPNTNHAVYHGLTGPYAALNGSVNPPALELPDGTGQGSKVWSGSGDPAYNLAQGSATAAIGDLYFERSSAFVVAASTRQTTSAAACTVGTSSPTSSTSLVGGTPAAGDLLIVIAETTLANTTTMTVGADSSITCTATNGGLNTGNGTQNILAFSRVVQAGDISSSKITATLSANLTGAGARLTMYVFRHPSGWSTHGSLHGCAPFTSATGSGTSSTTPISLSCTGPAGPTVSVAACYQNTGSPTHTYSWGNGPTPGYNNVFSTTNDSPGGAAITSVAAKPGVGVNNSGMPCIPTGNCSVVIGGVSNNQVALMGMWQPNGTSNPIMWMCTTAGTPGTWSQVI